MSFACSLTLCTTIPLLYTSGPLGYGCGLTLIQRVMVFFHQRVRGGCWLRGKSPGCPHILVWQHAQTPAKSAAPTRLHLDPEEIPRPV